MRWPDGISARAAFSRERMDALREEVGRTPDLQTLGDLCLYVTGSYGRGDAGPPSDVDIFFLHRGSSAHQPVTRIDKALADAALIRVCRQLGFPEFTKGGIYLDIHYVEDIRQALGSPQDDARNYFTARMLLVLESTCVHNEPVYREVVRRLIDPYYRDYADHAANFRPVFLLNDIVRYWKTMCVNYEARRTEKLGGPARHEELVKNFKLKYSRLLTCFSMITALSAAPPGVPEDEVLALVGLRPVERLARVATSREADAILEELLEEYAWFLGESEDKERLVGLLGDKDVRRRYFERAVRFGDLMYRLLHTVKQSDDVLRYLLV